MIARMSRVEIVGERRLLRDVISLLGNMGMFQIEVPEEEADEKEGRRLARTRLADEKTVFERLFLQDLRNKIDELLSHLPDIAVRESYIEPQIIISTISYSIDKHLALCREFEQKRASAEREAMELGRYLGFLNTMTLFFKDAQIPPTIDVMGLTIKDLGSVEHVKAIVAGLTGGKFKMLTIPSEGGTIFGLITIDRDLSETVSRALTKNQIPEMSFPSEAADLSLPDKIGYFERRVSELYLEIDGINSKIETMCRRWAPIYVAVRSWIDKSLSLIAAIAAVKQTQMCFFIHGWIPSKDLDILVKGLNEVFEGKIVIQEMEIRETDLERVPSVIENSPYFKPFELFTKILPLPPYASYDPTTFIGIFFPIFFGLILGDVGYGMFLGITSLVLIKKTDKEIVRNAAKILGISSLYSIFFGILFGEFFGDLPHRFFGVEPLWLDRRTAIFPMMYFTLGIGAVHILLGLLLGAISAFKRKANREAVSRLLNILVIIGMISVMASFFDIFPQLLTKPIIILILIILPFLFFTGGILAPLELLKSIGNIISYVRIMAIGITSVYLAYIANQLGGLTGNIVLGVFVAASLHTLNIVLGVFSPTIHSLRLHYVEFFSKFLETGGKKFEPLKK